MQELNIILDFIRFYFFLFKAKNNLIWRFEDLSACRTVSAVPSGSNSLTFYMEEDEELEDEDEEEGGLTEEDGEDASPDRSFSKVTNSYFIRYW